MKPPFPWFGGKSKVADLVWQRFGVDVPNYVEPFFGGGAVLFGRPGDNIGIETVNDKDAYLANFWRATQTDPQAVAEWADNPVNENDLHARHIWLVNQKADFVPRIEGDPDFYDAKIAGWWVWGLCCWIGSGWCSGEGPWQSVDGKLVHLGDAGRGVNRKLVHLGNAGQGVNRKRVNLGEYFDALRDRLRNVRVCCGDWQRICGPTPTFKHGMTAVFLDPPYSAEAGRDGDLYATEDLTVAHDVRMWCEANGHNPLLRIALCGYEGEGHDGLTDKGWSVVEWKAHGGYGSQGNIAGRENSNRERIWFSPACIKPEADQQQVLFP